ncbi:MAG: hypothetical protein H6821_16710 [Planctomycetaceae bacterium]|nr:hypothetical protein [Planctomycetales bacterium]MCB9875812.1 hypothetical protein [Planctomycetaceae bacterium]
METRSVSEEFAVFASLPSWVTKFDVRKTQEHFRSGTFSGTRVATLQIVLTRKGIMMLPFTTTVALHDALNRFQLQLDANVDRADPDELKPWAEQLRQAFDDLVRCLEEQWAGLHNQLFAEIGAQHTDQRKRIEELQQGNDRLQQQIEVVKSELIVLSLHADKDVEPRVENQTPEDETALDMVERGDELCQLIRDQERLVAVWLSDVMLAES